MANPQPSSLSFQRSPSRRNIGQTALRYFWATAAALLIAWFYRSILQVNQTTVALTFLILVQIAAFAWGLQYSFYLSILCTALYNFYFLPPIGTLVISDPQNWVALFVFFGSAVIVSNIAERERQQAAVSEARRHEIERLYEFSEQLLMDEQFHDLARHAPRIIATIFGLPSVLLYLAENRATYFSDPQMAFLSAEELEAISRRPESPRKLADGSRIVPLVLGMRTLGVMAMIEGAYSDGLYDAIAGLLAIALERAAALERFSHVEAAREGERLRNALLNSVTHELRTPLTAIRAAATSLVSQPMLGEEECREMYAIIDEESSRLDRLIGQTVEMARLDAEGVQLRVRPQKLREVVDMALEDSRLLMRGRTVNVEVPDDLPAVPMDRELIRRIFRHLLENAAAYSPAGSPVRISAALKAGRLLVTMANEGEGINEVDRPFVFDKFYRGTNHRHPTQGSGMGLAIVKAIVGAHQGGVDVISRRNEGAIFTFWIPTEEGAKKAVSPAGISSLPSGTSDATLGDSQ